MKKTTKKTINRFLATPVVLSLFPLFSSIAFGQTGPGVADKPGNENSEDRIEKNDKTIQEKTSPASARKSTSKNTTIVRAEDARATKNPSSPNEADEIVVTGSHIRGAIAAGANLDVYGAEDIERSGYATVQDFLQTLPQNFQGGGGTEDAMFGELISSNRFSGASVNLRGLGADSTLTLVNGRRVPSSGLSGDFTDVSSIPQSAVARIEILTDGASALYGSDAVGGVVNIILRDDFDAMETRLRYGGVTKGRLDEIRLAQALGHTWEGGNLIVNYEYFKRGSLLNTERRFAASRDLRPLGGGDYRVYYSDPGNILNPITYQPAYAIPANQDGRSLRVQDLIPGAINYNEGFNGTALIPKREQHSVYLNLEQDVTRDISVFLETRFHARKTHNFSGGTSRTSFVPSTNPFFIAPFGGAQTIVAHFLTPPDGALSDDGRVRTLNLVGGTSISFDAWKLNAYVSYGRERSRLKSDALDREAIEAALADPNPETALNVFGHGAVNNPETLEKLWIFSRENTTSKLTTANLKIDGPLFSLAGRTISLAVGADFRADRLHRDVSLGEELLSDRSHSRNIYSAFAEIFAPVFAPDHDESLLYRLDVSLAGRLERYSDLGSTFNPKIGLRWSPVQSTTLNFTYGTSFRAPNLVEKMSASNYSYLSNATDPRSPTGTTRTLFLIGNNPDLTREKAKIWTFGLQVRPDQIPGLSAEIGFFKTSFKDRISYISNLASVFFEEDIYGDLILRNPTAGMLAALCSDPRFSGNPAECHPGSVHAIVDARSTNFAKNTVKGIDFSTAYSKTIDTLILSAGISGTYLIDYALQVSPNAPSNDQVDTLGRPVDWRLRGNVSVGQGPFTATVFVNYTDSYSNEESRFQTKIDSYKTVDLNFTVDLNELPNLNMLPSSTLSLSATNLFDEDPPFVDNPLGVGYDPDNADALGRFVSIELKIQW